MVPILVVLGVHVIWVLFSGKALRVPPLRAGVFLRAVFEIKCEWPMQREWAHVLEAKKKRERKKEKKLFANYVKAVEKFSMCTVLLIRK